MYIDEREREWDRRYSRKEMYSRKEIVTEFIEESSFCERKVKNTKGRRGWLSFGSANRVNRVTRIDSIVRYQTIRGGAR